MIKSNNLPTAAVATSSTAGGTADKYAGDFSNTICAFGQAEAVGTVKLLDLAMESAWIPEKRSNLMLAEYAVGHGTLRTECAGVIQNVA